MADGIVPDIIWVVLFGGAALTIGFTFFFGAENLRAQALMTGVLAILIFAGLLTIVAIDHPFAGTVKVGPDALLEVLVDYIRIDRASLRGQPASPSRPSPTPSSLTRYPPPLLLQLRLHQRAGFGHVHLPGIFAA